MKKRLNIKAFGIMLLVVGVLGVGVHFLHGYQVRSNAGILLAQAERADGEKRVRAAVGYLGRYLALEPSDSEARCKYALLLTDKEMVKKPKDLLRAYFVLSRAVQLAPDRSDVRRKLIDVAMDPVLQRFSDAAEHLELLPATGEVLGLRARCLEESAKYQEARASYERAIAGAPGELNNYVRLANLLRTKAVEVRKAKDENLDALADGQINAMVTANPKAYLAFLIRSRYLKQRLGQTTEEEKKKLEAQIRDDIQQARTLAPGEIDVILAVADVEREKHDPKAAEQARAVLQAGLKEHNEPEAWRLVQALAQVEMLDGKPKAALARLRDGLTKFPGQVDLLWNYANLLIQQQDPEAAGAIERLNTAGMPREELDYLAARILVNNKQWRGAARLLEGAYPLFLKGFDERRNWFALNLALECNFLLGNCYEQLGDPYRAASAYDRVVAREPRSVGGLVGLARMKWALGQLEAAEQRYRQAASLWNAPAGTWVELIQLMIARTLLQPKENHNWKAVLAAIDLAEKRPKEQRPAQATLALLRAEVAAGRKEYESARLALKDVKDEKGNRPAEVWVGLAGLAALESGRADSALAILDEAIKALGNRVELRIAKARHWARKGGPEAAKALAALGRGIERFEVPEQLRLLRVLAEAQGQVGEPKEAVKLWQQIATTEGHEDLSAWFTLFEWALVTKDMHAMNEQVKRMQGFEGEAEGSLWRYCRACQRIWQAEQTAKKDRKEFLDEASSLLKIVADRRSGWSRVPVAQGQVDELQGRAEAALANYKRALVLGESRPAVIQKLVLVFTLNRDYLMVDELTRKLEARSPKLLEGLEQPKAVAMFMNGNKEQALALARKAVPNESKNYRDHIWLARLLRAADAKLAPEAEASLRRALVLADQVPETWVALIQFLAREERKADAEAVLKEAEAKLPREKAQLELAQCHEVLGHKARAKAIYDAAYAARPEDAGVLYALATFHVRAQRTEDVERAKQHLTRILQLKTGTPEEIARAKRLLAVLIASGGGYEKSMAALALLDGDDRSTDEPTSATVLADQRARVIILANQLSARKRREAIAILEDLRRKQVVTMEERFLLARLNETVGDWSKTRSQLTALLTSLDERIERLSAQDRPALQSAYAGYLAYYAYHLLRRGDVGEAQIWQAKLERLEPDTWRSVEIKARLLGKQGQDAKQKQDNGKQAVALVRKALGRDGKRLSAAAQVFEDIGQLAEAQALFEKYAADKSEPHRVLALATFLARRDRPGEALDICERAWKTCKPGAVASVSVAVVYLAKSGKQQAERVAVRLEQAIAADAGKLELHASLAAVRRLQGRAEDALQLLRQVSEGDKSNALVHNNIAWLLALDNRPDEALASVKRAIMLRGEEANLLDTRAVAYIVKGQHAQAVDDLREAIAEGPTASRYFHLARAHLGAGDIGAARAAIVRAKDLGLTETAVDPLERAALRDVLAKTDRR